MRPLSISLSALTLFALSACNSTPPSPSPRASIAATTTRTTADVAATTSESGPFAPGTSVSALIAEQGEPDFVTKPSPRMAAMLKALEATRAMHFRFPDSATLSFAVGVKDDHVTGTMVFIDAGPTSMFLDPVDYYHARARGERVRWKPAGIHQPGTVAASAPRITSTRLGASFDPGH